MNPAYGIATVPSIIPREGNGNPERCGAARSRWGGAAKQLPLTAARRSRVGS